MRTTSSLRQPALENDEAWRKLPDAPLEVQQLPVWARQLADWQPITTARMLDLDAMHRTGDRLDARLRAVARWAAAEANRCEYAKAMAEADYDRSTGHATRLAEQMREGHLSEMDRLAAAFAGRMMTDAAGVTDEEVKRLLDLLGDERMVALVTLIAHASFQDRVLLALGVGPELAATAPVTAKFGRPKPTRPPPIPETGQWTDSETHSAEWQRTRQGLNEQKRRPGRIAVPSIEAVRDRLGADHPTLWQNGLVWSRVCFGHQPALTEAWFDATAAFRQECDLDPVFATSLFWVVTDALNCFY